VIERNPLVFSNEHLLGTYRGALHAVTAALKSFGDGAALGERISNTCCSRLG